MSEPIRVAVSGACGRMGRLVCATVEQAHDLELVAAVDVAPCPQSGTEKRVESDLSVALESSDAKVLVDFTTPDAVVANALTALEGGVAPILGTTGIEAADLERIRQASERLRVPALVVPNFAIGAVLMMRFAEEAAKWFPQAEIVEMHHDGKLDAPSGTAIATAKRMANVRAPGAGPAKTENIKFEGARGATVEGIPVHSVRLPGLVAHQTVLFGGLGEGLTIRHDSMDRSCFMPGVLLAIRKVWERKGLTVGLDALVFETRAQSEH